MTGGRNGVIIGGEANVQEGGMEQTKGLTAEMYKAVVAIVDERVREIRVTREAFSALRGAVLELAQAQARTEARLEGLAQAPARTEARWAELAEATAGRGALLRAGARARARPPGAWGAWRGGGLGRAGGGWARDGREQGLCWWGWPERRRNWRSG